jgi:DNA-binding response OmpR family regulator
MAFTKVLVVEDDPSSREVLVALANSWGHQVASSEKAGGGLAELVSFQPDCVILDLMLPDSNGIEVLRFIRQNHFPVKVAVLTATTDPDILDEVKLLNPDLLLIKPADFDELRKWLGGCS